MRHVPRQPDRSPTIHSHPHSLAAHINGSAPVPSTPNGSSHAIVSPAAVPNPVPNGAAPSPSNMIHKLAVANEQTWLLIGISLSLGVVGVSPFAVGRVAEQMNDLEHALSAYENALRHNPMSMSGLTQVAGIARIKENYPKVKLLSLQCQVVQPYCPRILMATALRGV